MLLTLITTIIAILLLSVGVQLRMATLLGRLDERYEYILTRIKRLEENQR